MGSLLELSRTIEERDPTTRGHSARVTAFAEVIALRLGCDAHVLSAIQLGGPLHDIGKVAVSDAVLLKAGNLDEAERAEIRVHPVAGARLLDGELHQAVGCVLHHHERWDGMGYPDGLAGEQIPLEARILAVADAYDAMTSDRTYRRALHPRQAAGEIRSCAGTQFDPAVAEAFSGSFEAGDIGWATLGHAIRAAAS